MVNTKIEQKLIKQTQDSNQPAEQCTE